MDRRNAGMGTGAGSPEQLASMVKSEINRMSKIIKDAGIRGE
jgi:tripartite-type tricarboxylate transporter receptor subunit TctC